jgi:hypothetical protein
MKDMAQKVVNARIVSLVFTKPMISFMVTKTITKLTNKPKPVYGTQTHKISSGCEMQPQLLAAMKKLLCNIPQLLQKHTQFQHPKLNSSIL